MSKSLYEVRVLRVDTLEINCSFYMKYSESVYVVCTSTTVLRE